VVDDFGVELVPKGIVKDGWVSEIPETG